MILIPLISEENKELFYNNVKDLYLSFLTDNRNNTKYNKIINYFIDPITNDFDEKKIKKVLIGDKSCLEDAINKIGKISNDDTINNVYRNFRGSQFAKEWPEKIGIRVCPYCNKNFIASSHDLEYDHYFLKKNYPYLNVSMMNLIPCCSTCNHDKGEWDVFSKAFTYPYVEEFGYDICFSVTKNIMDRDDYYSIEIKNNNGEKLPDYIENEINKLATINIYSKQQYEIGKIFKKVYKRNIARKKSIENSFGIKVDDDEDFAEYLDKNNWPKIQFSKIKCDIIKMYSND